MATLPCWHHRPARRLLDCRTVTKFRPVEILFEFAQDWLQLAAEFPSRSRWAQILTPCLNLYSNRDPSKPLRATVSSEQTMQKNCWT